MMMKKLFSPLSILAFCVLSFTIHAQIETPQPSTGSTLIQKVGLAEIKIEYSRPSKKGRAIFGADVVPFDAVWRLGANQPTKMTISDSITVKGKGLAKGSYIVLAKPGKDSWDIMFNKNPTASATSFKAEDNVTVNVPVVALPFEIQNFTINIGNITNTGADIEMYWDKTFVAVPFTNDVDSKVMAQIKAKLDGPSQGDYQAMSQYYFETGKDLAQSLDFVNKALAKGERYWLLRHKSLVQAKMGDKKGAIETAKKSLAAAQEAKNNDYVRMNEKSIAEWTKM